MRITLRSVDRHDFEFLAQLIRAAYRDLCIRQFGTWDDEADRQRLSRKVREIPHRIVELDGKPIGAVALVAHADHLRLAELSILPEFQNLGIGAQVLTDEMARAKSLNLPLRLHTPSLNRARQFYRRHGFVETGTDGDYVNFEWRP